MIFIADKSVFSRVWYIFLLCFKIIQNFALPKDYLAHGELFFVKMYTISIFKKVITMIKYFTLLFHTYFHGYICVYLCKSVHLL